MFDPPRGFLVIDDSEDFCVLVSHVLQKAWPEARVDTWNPLEKGRPEGDFDWSSYDVVLLDYNLGKDDGLRWLRRYGRVPGFPATIMLTGEGDEEIAVKAFKLGVADYIPKRQLNRAVLVNAINEVLQGEAEEVEAPSSQPFAIPGYRVLERIGSGASAAVYKVERKSDGQLMVIKILHTDRNVGDTFVERFLKEYDLIDRIRDRNVVRIYDRGATDESLYIAMEYFAGGDLQSRLDRERILPTAEALDIAMQIVRGLAAIHGAGVIHRDLKPSNVMFRADGSIAIIDFGIARDLEEDARLTIAGQIFGTPGFTSPENLAGLELDTRSDLYSVGVILFRMLTGNRPYAGGSLAAIVYQQMNVEPPPLPEALSRFQPIIDRTLVKDRDLRYPNAAALLEALQSVPVEAPAAHFPGDSGDSA